MKIKITRALVSAGPNSTQTVPIPCTFDDRNLEIGIRPRRNSVTGGADIPPLYVIDALGFGISGARIALSAEVWPTPSEALFAWNNGFEVADPKEGTEEGRFVIALIEQGIAEGV
jgi:hypothetical protein